MGCGLIFAPVSMSWPGAPSPSEPQLISEPGSPGAAEACQLRRSVEQRLPGRLDCQHDPAPPAFLACNRVPQDASWYVPSIHPSIHSSIHPSYHPSIHLSIHASMHHSRCVLVWAGHQPLASRPCSNAQKLRLHAQAMQQLAWGFESSIRGQAAGPVRVQRSHRWAQVRNADCQADLVHPLMHPSSIIWDICLHEGHLTS